jgi:hypothetical protein
LLPCNFYLLLLALSGVVKRSEQVLQQAERQMEGSLKTEVFPYLLRCGKKQLDQLNSPDTVGLSSLNVTFSETKKP